MTRPAGQLERSLAALTIGVAQNADNRRRALADSHTGEWVQQIRVPLSGQASQVWFPAQTVFTWEMPFLHAELQRRVPFTTPQVSDHVEFHSRGGLVLVQTHLIGWTITEENWIIGATVEFSAIAPNTTDLLGLVPWSATAHLAFQGYGTYAEGT